MKYVAYYRTSTKEQNLGLAAQRSTVLRFLRNDDILIGEYTEQESGKNDNRKELTKAIQHCKATGSTLLIAKLDRLSRNLTFISQLQDSELPFVCCDMPKANELTISIFAALAQHERKLISQRTKAALQEIKTTIDREGSAVSKSGNTFTKLGKNNITDSVQKKGVATIKANALERNKQVIEHIRSYREKKMSFQQIADKLNELGYTTKTGKPFVKASIKILFDRYTQN